MIAKRDNEVNDEVRFFVKIVFRDDEGRRFCFRIRNWTYERLSVLLDGWRSGLCLVELESKPGLLRCFHPENVESLFFEPMK